MKTYLIIACDDSFASPLCDADRTPICLTNDYSPYKKWGYEVYEVQPDGTFEIIQEYDAYTQKGKKIKHDD